MIHTTSLLIAGAFLLASSVERANADMYLHNPPGSNNRNREENGNANNQNRMFDSQNNAAGGYPWRGDPNVAGSPDELQYYPDSMLRVEWTVQHACGAGSNVECEVVLQYACEDTMTSLRDGYPTGPIADQGQDGYTKATFQSQGQNGAGTNQIPMPRVAGSSGARFDANDANFGTNAANLDANLRAFYAGQAVGDYQGVEFGMHEDYDYYAQQVIGTERNQGLYIADRNLGGDSARYTRQNNGGTRRGFESPEERDYYPYWQPTPWRDIAVMTSDLDRCAYYQANSQNTVSKFRCVMPADSDLLAPISETACLSVDGVWSEVAAFGTAPPECLLHASSRDNHLGNTVAEGETKPSTASYNWKIPAEADVLGKQCVFRVRYNMSSTNYDAYANYYTPARPMVDASYNCQDETGEQGTGNCGNNIAVDGVMPLYQDPYVEVFDDMPYMGLNINTNQIGRTFQDRSYIFSIRDAPATTTLQGGACSTVWNLNVRGKRGNIVQAYPAVEYDFVPSELEMSPEECVHVQFHNSDFNENNVAGNGADGTDASNLVQIHNQAGNIPLHSSKVSMFESPDMALAFMMVGQNPANCADIKEDDNNDQDFDNCGKLNSRVNKFDVGGPIKFTVGSHEAINIRNNDFSNRSHKLKVTVAANAGSSGSGGSGNGNVDGSEEAGEGAAGAGSSASGSTVAVGIGALCAVGLFAGVFTYRRKSRAASLTKQRLSTMSSGTNVMPAMANIGGFGQQQQQQQPQPGFQGNQYGYGAQQQY